jgi:hypothetical protein
MLEDMFGPLVDRAPFVALCRATGPTRHTWLRLKEKSFHCGTTVLFGICSCGAWGQHWFAFANQCGAEAHGKPLLREAVPTLDPFHQGMLTFLETGPLPIPTPQATVYQN